MMLLLGDFADRSGMADVKKAARRLDVSVDSGFRPRSSMLTRRSFAMLACAALASGCFPSLSGCSSGKNVVVDAPEVEEAAVRLTFFGFKYESLNVVAIEGILRAYMDAHADVSIVYEGVKSRPYFDALGKRLSSGFGDDVFMVDHDTALAFEEAGYLADLSDLPTIDLMSDLALGQMRSEGVIDYVPTSISAFGLYCNTDLLASCGIEVPEALPQFERACEVFAAAGVVPLVANNDISLKTVAIACGLASVYASDGEAAVASFNDDPALLASALRKGFDVVERIVANGWVDAPLALETEKTADDLEQFATGAFPFMLTGAWAAARMRDLAPELAFEVHPYPVLDDRSVLVVNVDTRVSVNADSPHVDEAKDFVSFFTQPDSIESFAGSQCSFSPLKGNAAPGEPSVQPLAAAFSQGGAVIASDDNLRFPIWENARQCVVAMLGGATAQEAEAMLLSLITAETGDAS